MRPIEVHVIVRGNGIVHRHLHRHRVAGHVHRHSAALELHLVGIHLPSVVTRRGVFGHGVGQFDVDIAAGEHRTVHANGLLREVYAVTLKVELLEIAADTCGMYKSVGVYLHVAEAQRVNLHTLLQQRQQLDVNHKFAGVGYGVAQVGYRVVGFLDVKSLQAQVKRKTKPHMLYLDVHAGLLGSILGNLSRSPVLERREIEKTNQCRYRQHQSKQRNA